MTVSVTLNGQTVSKQTTKSYTFAVVATNLDGSIRVLNWSTSKSGAENQRNWWFAPCKFSGHVAAKDFASIVVVAVN